MIPGALKMIRIGARHARSEHDDRIVLRKNETLLSEHTCASTISLKLKIA